MDEFVYLQGLTASKIELPKAFGHKKKQKQEAKVAPAPQPRQVPAPRVLPAPIKGKAREDKRKASPPQREQKDVMCISERLADSESKKTCSAITVQTSKLPVKHRAGIHITRQ